MWTVHRFSFFSVAQISRMHRPPAALQLRPLGLSWPSVVKSAFMSEKTACNPLYTTYLIYFLQFLWNQGSRRVFTTIKRHSLEVEAWSSAFCTTSCSHCTLRFLIMCHVSSANIFWWYLLVKMKTIGQALLNKHVTMWIKYIGYKYFFTDANAEKTNFNYRETFGK